MPGYTARLHALIVGLRRILINDIARTTPRGTDDPSASQLS